MGVALFLHSRLDVRTDKPIAPLKKLSFLEFPTLSETPPFDYRQRGRRVVERSHDRSWRAPSALYRAKEAGRNCVETSSFAPELVAFRRPVGLSIQKRSAA